MLQVSNNDFKILSKYKEFLNKLDDILENVPRKDMYYKDKTKEIGNNLLNEIFKCSYDEKRENTIYYRIKIKAYIAELDFMLDRLHSKRYISERTLYKVGNDLVEINKMVTGWLNKL